MSRLFRGPFVIGAILLMLSWQPPRPGRACSIVVPGGTAVDVAEESAVIVWDAATHTEHFIRRATFQTQAKDFGFLVPTPTTPLLAPASDGAFVSLEKLMEPKVETTVLTGCVFTSWLFPPVRPLTTAGVATPQAAVRVLSSQNRTDLANID